MSLLVFFIALLPAAIVFVVAALTRSRGWTTTSAVIAALVGALSGNPAYMLLDVGVVVFIYWVCIRVLPKSTSAQVVAATPPVLVQTSSKTSLIVSTVLWFAVLLAVVTLGSLYLGSPSRQASTISAPSRSASPVSVSPLVPSPDFRAAPPRPLTKSEDATKNTPSLKPAISVQHSKPIKPTKPTQPTTDGCLRMKSEEQMIACLQTAE